jgi:hypothetical protein
MRRVSGGRRLAAGMLLVPGLAAATVYQGNPGNYLTLLEQLQPGDTLQLAAGTYVDQLLIENLHGSAGAWITITGPHSGAPAIFRADNCCNTVQFDNASYIEVSYLTLDAQGTDGPFGVDSRDVTHHITISDLTILNYGADQQDDGISTKGPAWNWTVRRNLIIGAGTGMYFGGSDGSWPFVAGLIEYNVVLDTIGYNLEIKHQNPRPTGIGLPTGLNRTIIRHNVFSKKNTPIGMVQEAQPNVLVGHLPLSGEGQDDSYEIYGNFFYENPTEALFQGEGNIGLYANLFVTSSGDAINIIPHNAVPRQVTVFQNTVVAAGSGILISGGNPNFTQRIIGNAVFASSPLQGPNKIANITAPYASAHLYVNDPYGPIGELDLYPLPGMLTGALIDTSALSAYTDWNRDFNASVRDQSFRGAYSGEGSNPGWQLALDMKNSVASGPSPPTVSLAAMPTSVTSGGSTTLTWSSTDATQCTASGAWSGNKATSGSAGSGALSSDSSFTLTCTGAGGSGSDTISVTVTAPQPGAPQVQLDAAPAAVGVGESATLTWSSTNATQCMASGDWSGSKMTSGSEDTGALASSGSYTLTCTGASGSASDTELVTVAAAPPPAGGSTGSSSGGGALDWSWLALLAGAALRKSHLTRR